MIGLHDTMNTKMRADGAIVIERPAADRLPELVNFGNKGDERGEAEAEPLAIGAAEMRRIADAYGEIWKSLSPAQQEVITKAMIQTEIDGAAMFTSTVEEVIATITADGVKEIKLSPEDAKAFYIAYRDSMWAEDLARWPDIAPQLKEWLVDPAFPRAN